MVKDAQMQPPQYADWSIYENRLPPTYHVYEIATVLNVRVLMDVNIYKVYEGAWAYFWICAKLRQFCAYFWIPCSEMTQMCIRSLDTRLWLTILTLNKFKCREHRYNMKRNVSFFAYFWVYKKSTRMSSAVKSSELFFK